MSGYESRNVERSGNQKWQATFIVSPEKEAFLKQYGSQWTEFARLRYFDLVRFTLIDPMHNWLQGMAKWQWYEMFIKRKVLRPATATMSPLAILTLFLFTQFESPLWAGELPPRLGEPAGGSLSADAYKMATTGPLCMIVSNLSRFSIIALADAGDGQLPVIWDQLLDDAVAEHKDDLTKYNNSKELYEAALTAWQERDRKRTTKQRQKAVKGDAKPKPPKRPFVRMHKDEPAMFLRFATSVKLFLGSSIYGDEHMTPNQHWSVHTADQILDYGPVYNFWTFMTERLNKILKNINNNHWGGGRLEVSMMRGFGRETQFETMVCIFLM
ncbi:hypothetical protein FIBSPDRAFT_907050 [Athelia psychrophila]|uniref:Uncharacterized protein n=1 Tax=Athelia psychrophila TaxID=1759441 RepID=A0A166VHX0_9AGAM|nr:hypothetical protein FIBSPDRAFT_907050 [Fibularhizoctonia sp. CBS 109695]